VERSGPNQNLEHQRRETERLVYRWFRFKTRRALGLLYCLFSFLPPVGEALYLASGSALVSLVGAVVVGVVCSLAFRAAGYRGFGGMINTIEMLRGKDTSRSPIARVTLAQLLAIWPFVAFVVVTSTGEGQLDPLIAVLWLVDNVITSVWIARSTRSPIVDPEIEDWLAAVSFPVGAMLSTLPVVPAALHPYGFLLVSPLLAFCGIKSLYEAPKELVASLD
jgi:hypothetical protein